MLTFFKDVFLNWCIHLFICDVSMFPAFEFQVKWDLNICSTLRDVRRKEAVGASEEIWLLWYLNSFKPCNWAYALVLGHAHHVNVRTAGHSPGVVRPDVHDLIPETNGTQCADMMWGLLVQLLQYLLLFVLYLAVLSLIYSNSLFSVKLLRGNHLLDLSLCETAAFECCVLWLNTVLRKVWTLWNCLSLWCVLVSDIITFRSVCLS